MRAPAPPRGPSFPSLARAAVLALVALAGGALTGCPNPGRSAGETCAFNGDCVAGYVCAGRRCRVECRSDRDCPDGHTCLPSGQPDKRVCLPPTAPRPCLYAEECPSPRVCTRDGFCSPQCRADVDCALYDPGARCVCLRGVAVCTFHPALADGAAPDDAATCLGRAADGGAP